MGRYDLCKKYKWFDWIDDNIFWYIYDKPKSWYKSFRCWWYCDATNPWHWKLVWFSIENSRPWDPQYTRELIYLHIQKSRYYFINKATFLGDAHRKSIIKWQTICLSLLEILTEKRDLYDMIENPNKEGFNYEYKCLVNVNTKNVQRFAQRGVNYNEPTKTIKCWEYMLNQPHELYLAKAKYLLFRILDEYSGEWWD